MKMICLYRTMLRGDIVKPGKVLELSDAECEMDVVKQFFRAVEESSAGGVSPAETPVPTKTAEVVAGLTRDQAISKLRQAGAHFRGNISNADLVTLYNQTFANLAEAMTK